MTKRQLAAAKTKEKLLDAAKELICGKGLTDTTVDEITEKCGVAKGTFYTYFKRKEDVVFELSARMFGEILESAKSFAGSFPEKLEHYMLGFSRYIEKGSLKLCQEWVKNAALPSPEAAYGAKKLKSDLAAVRELFRCGVESGALRRDTPTEELAESITDLLYGQMLCWCIADGAYGFEARTSEFCAFFLRGFLNNYLTESQKEV